MAIGDIRIINGEEYEVVWSGGEGLVSDRETKNINFWSPPKRVYNKKSDYWTKPRVKSVNHFGEEEDEGLLRDYSESTNVEPHNSSTEQCSSTGDCSSGE